MKNKAKSTKKPGKVKVHLPFHEDHPAMSPVIVEPAPLDLAKVEPLKEESQTICCIGTPGWFGGVMLTPEDGSDFPKMSDTGTRMIVKLLPPIPAG